MDEISISSENNCSFFAGCHKLALTIRLSLKTENQTFIRLNIIGKETIAAPQ
jgi:hypothetical protein